jgi:hypothetical protein
MYKQWRYCYDGTARTGGMELHTEFSSVCVSACFVPGNSTFPCPAKIFWQGTAVGRVALGQFLLP